METVHTLRTELSTRFYCWHFRFTEWIISENESDFTHVYINSVKLAYVHSATRIYALYFSNSARNVLEFKIYFNNCGVTFRYKIRTNKTRWNSSYIKINFRIERICFLQAKLCCMQIQAKPAKKVICIFFYNSHSKPKLRFNVLEIPFIWIIGASFKYMQSGNSELRFFGRGKANFRLPILLWRNLLILYVGHEQQLPWKTRKKLIKEIA